MVKGDGEREQPFIRSYDAPTTPISRVDLEALRALGDQSPRAKDADWDSPMPRRLGDIPIRTVYTVIAALGTVLAVVLVFVLFSGDKPEVEAVHQAQPTPSASASASPSPSPVVVPRVPAARSMTVHPGANTPLTGYVTDMKAGLSYAQYGAPWKKSSGAPFSAVQRAGSVRLPRAMIVSSPLPGSVPGLLNAPADYRKLAVRAARWSLRYQPAESKFTWTASQPVRSGTGWMLGYKVSYLVEGERRSSQAIVAVIGTGRDKPAMLFATVPDTRKELFRDLNMLYWTVRPI
jgi:hypothetical protein